MSRPPQWAVDLLHQVCEDYDVEPPELVWRRSRKHPWSSGHYSLTGSRIVVTAGGPRHEQKVVLLHELAHHLAPPKEHHSVLFWEIAWRLFRRYGVPIRYARQRSRDYRKASEVAFRTVLAEQRAAA